MNSETIFILPLIISIFGLLKIFLQKKNLLESLEKVETKEENLLEKIKRIKWIKDFSPYFYVQKILKKFAIFFLSLHNKALYFEKKLLSYLKEKEEKKKDNEKDSYWEKIKEK